MTRDSETLHVAFAPLMVAGLRTQWDNMRPHLPNRSDPTARGVQTHIAEIHSYQPGGTIERLPLAPAVLKGNLRTFASAGALFGPPRLDALWVHDVRATLPYVLTKGLAQRTVVLCATDATSRLQADFGALYPNKRASDSLRGRARDALDTFALRRATLLLPWSEWAARSLREDHGIPSHSIHVMPPGIDLARWPVPHRRRADGEPLRLLFVGADFARKGGELLLDVFSARLQARRPGRYELHLVTRAAVAPRPGVFVYRDFLPNDPGLRELYARCDVFVLPTRADCFSLAGMEAMASGLPVITCNVGGIPEIVDEGRSGYLIAPGDGAALAARLDALIESPELRASMGLEGRRIVEARFDAARNTAQLLDLIAETCQRRNRAGARATADQRHA